MCKGNTENKKELLYEIWEKKNQYTGAELTMKNISDRNAVTKAILRPIN